MYVINNDLPYVLIGLPQCKQFKLNIDCVNNIIAQNNRRISIINNNIDKTTPKTLHVSFDNHEPECNNDIKGTQNRQIEDNVCTEFRSIYNNYQTISESETNLVTNGSKS